MRLLGRYRWLAGFGAATFLVALVMVPGAAQAVFPGRDGLLAVQLLKGPGIVLIKADGRGERRVVCSRCSLPPISSARPQWSPDGRTLVLDERYKSSPRSFLVASAVIYPDGSCLECSLDYGPSVVDAAFTSDPTLFTAVSQWELVEFGFDGVPKKLLLLGAVSDPVWSSRGQLALVQGGWIWVGSPGSLRRLTRGSALSWSPNGRRIAFVRRGWLMTVPVRGGGARRLVRGTAPAWSPDGRWIAFFGVGHRLSVVRASGGRVQPVGEVTGSAVDWQPLPAKQHAPCLAPPGSSVAASGETAIVTFDSSQPSNGWAVLGCLRADGRQRVLASDATTYGSTATAAAVAGHYAALVFISYCGRPSESQWSAGVALFDLRTGAEVPDRGGESAVSDPYTGLNPSTCQSSMDQLVLGSDAVSAVHTSGQKSSCSCTVERIEASDSRGARTLDSVTEPQGSPNVLTNLTLTEDTLTWEHNGTPHSAQLHP